MVHLSKTPLAGSPIRIVNALNRHTSVKARLINLNPLAYGARTFEEDLLWDTDREACLEVIRSADIVHLHHAFDVLQPLGGIDLRTKQLVRQHHSCPVNQRGERLPDEAAFDAADVPRLVIPNCAERYFPAARVVPNIVPLHDAAYCPVVRNDEFVRVAYSPSFLHSAWGPPPSLVRWDTKGRPEIERLLRAAVHHDARISPLIITNVAHRECLRLKQASDVAIDDLVTGGFHLNSFEALAMGLPTFCFLDGRSTEMLRQLTGAADLPFVNLRLEEALDPLLHLAKNRDLREEIGRASRDWMLEYYDDAKMASHYVQAYVDLLEDPSRLRVRRFDPMQRKVHWDTVLKFDLAWSSRGCFAKPDDGEVEDSRTFPRVVLFGASTGGARAMDQCSGRSRVVCFVDSDPSKQGTLYCGVPVCRPEAILGVEFDYVIIASVYSADMLRQLQQLAIPARRIRIWSAGQSPIDATTDS